MQTVNISKQEYWQAKPSFQSKFQIFSCFFFSCFIFLSACTSAENPLPKALKNKILGTWTLDEMFVLRQNATNAARWDTVPNPSAEIFKKATLTFEIDGSYKAFDPTYNRTTNRGTLFFARLDFNRGWSRNSPYGGLWEFVENYGTIHFDKGFFESLGIPAEKWLIEEFTTDKLRIYKDATRTRERVWYTFKR